MGFLKSVKRTLGIGDNRPKIKPISGPFEIARKDDPSRVDAALSNQQAREQLAASQGQAPGRFSGAVRDADAIEESGVLAEFAKIDTSRLEKKSEAKRSIDDDAMLVRKGFSGFSAEQIHEMKEKAYAGSFHDERNGKNASPTDKKSKKLRSEILKEEKGAVKRNYYGSETHKEYGAMVEHLSGGLISAEEAMAMNPTGGIAGPGAMGLAFEKDNPLRRHAIRHDAVGFLKTRFGVGPGYGTKTSKIGFKSDNPLAGQWLGIGRQVVKGDERLDTSDIGTSQRFSGQSLDSSRKKG
jgi:hypothetical protein